MNDSITDVEIQIMLASPITCDAAAEKIYDRYMPAMRRVASRRLQNRFAARLGAEDVLQSTWRSFHGCVEALRVTDSFWPYLFSILTRKIARAFETHTAAKRDVRREITHGHCWVEQAITGRCHKSEWLQEALSALGPLHRQVIELRLGGYCQVEIAERLGKSVRFVQRYQQSAIEILREQLKSDLDNS